MQPIYLVTGYMRSGTSMMMQCLVRGGLEAVVEPEREKMNKRRGDQHYKPNRHGFYEANIRTFEDFYRVESFEGKLIKALRPSLGMLRPWSGGYHVVCMRRDREEIRQSFQAFYGEDPNDPFFPSYELLMDWIRQHAENRLDVLSFHQFEYRRVVEEPFPHFEQLASHGWPIDPNAAAAGVDPRECRFRLELLEPGIRP